MAQGKHKLVYVGPEQFRNRAFLFAVTQIPVSLLVVEDAHRVSSWGHDFRSDYLNISKTIVEMDSQPRILALTGACTQQTRDDIRYQLQIHDARTYVLDLARPELSLEVSSAFSPEEKYDILGSLVRKLSGQGIIYANSRRQTAEICEFLRESESSVAIHHAGLTRDKRVQVERDFDADQLRIIIATTTGSFGANLGKSNIRYIIHFDMPDRLERYYEQISMAGRDGQPAQCILIYSPSDRGFHHSMIEMNAISPAEAWRINEVLESRAGGNKGFTIPLVKDTSQSPSGKALNDWLKEHFKSLPVEAQKELDRRKDEYKNLESWDRNPYSPNRYEKYLKSERWKEFSKQILAGHEQCQVCERRSQHVHHLHYRNLEKEKSDDVLALCDKCHCFIHPDNPMTKKVS